MKRFVAVTIFVLFILATMLTIQQSGSMAQAQDLSNESGYEEVALRGDLKTNIVSYSSASSGWTIHVRPGVRFGSNDRVIGYTDFLVPVYFTDKSLLFLNPKVSWDDRDGYEFNVGAGYRHMLLGEKLILGGNLYYDWRRSSSGEKYHQLGVGLEAMTEFDVTALNARVNGYISLSDEEILKTWREYYFTSTGLGYTTAYTVEEPLSGLDYELGFRIPGISNYVETWVYAGGYNYFGDYSEDINGFMARLEIIPTSFVRASYEYRNDNIRGDEHYGEFTVEIPFSIENMVAGKNPFEGIGSRVFNGSRDMKTRMYDMVRRDVDIVVESVDITKATYPDDVLPGDSHSMGLVYVDNSKNAPGAGSGTLEDPYGDINTALLDPKVPSTCVFVFKGSGPYLETVTMMDGLQIWGQGYDRFNMGLSGFPVVRGNDIGGGPYGHSVDMGNNTALMGFQLENTLDSANNFIVRMQNISDASLIKNRIMNNGMGVVILNSDDISIINNSITLKNEGIASNVYGIAMTGDAGVFNNIVISGNKIDTTLSGAASSSIDTGGIMAFRDNVIDGCTITNNTIILRNADTTATTYHNTYGIDFQLRSGGIASNVVISGNKISLYGGIGNAILCITEVDNFKVFNNVFSTEGNIGDGEYGISITGRTNDLIIHNNLFLIKSGVGSGCGLEFSDWSPWGYPAPGPQDIELYNNTFIFSGSSPNYGLLFDEDILFNVKVYRNILKGVMDTGIYLDSTITAGSVIDLGGGALGSPGKNSVSGFTNFAVDNQWGTTIDAKKNWWGTATPTGAMFNGSVNYIPFLDSKP